ncbi:NTE family protein [Marinobacter antarcticus]|uniref:NTE family protein n=2 Tax=Marinobacter antarcticus TaxID=564117 RepID=A0A1M6P6G5_9GAMM|nr:NTE family protein [Marinobacter antarcticus]
MTLICLAVALLMSLPAAASNTMTERPRVGLVLSGGGAKGMAHVGVLRVLEEMNIPVDMVVGTSAGSAVGALYASGMSVAEIEQRFINMDWLSSFRDDPGRAFKPVRRKQGEWRFPVTPGLGVSADGLHLGAGIIAGQNLGFILNELTRNVALVEDFDRLPIPFRAVATDLETGDMVVLRSGNLATAVRASMSIPGVYAPANLDGRLLVDGGVANNLPVNVARDMGADVIIAVDITDALVGPDNLREAFSIFGQLTTIMTRRNTDQQLDLLGEQDVLIQPDLEGHSSANFYNAPVLFELGASGARAHAVELNSLAVSNEAWQAYRSRLASANHNNSGLIARVEVEHDRRLGRKFLRERIRQKAGEPLDVEALEADLKRIYGLGYYETVSYSQSPSPDGTLLKIKVQEKSWGPNYLSFGLNYEDNFDGDTRFNLASSLRVTELNELGAEWQTGLQFGTEPRIRTQWYQPLDYGYERFLVVGAEYSRDTFSIYGSGDERVAELDVTFRRADLSLGMELGGNAEVRFTYARGYATVDEQIGTAVAPDGAVHQGNLSLQLVHDSLDDAFFPREGAFAGIRGRLEREGLGSDRHFDSVTGMALGTDSWKGFTLTGLLYAHTVTRGEAGIENAVRLGGFRRLSAYAPGQITGNSAAMASVYASQAFGGPIVPWFAGMGLEAGNAWESLSDAGWNSSVKSWSIFAGLDTFLGPVQIATAYNNKDNWAAYLNIGFSFTQLFY